MIGSICGEPVDRNTHSIWTGGATQRVRISDSRTFLVETGDSTVLEYVSKCGTRTSQRHWVMKRAEFFRLLSPRFLIRMPQKYPGDLRVRDSSCQLHAGLELVGRRNNRLREGGQRFANFNKWNAIKAFLIPAGYEDRFD